MSNDSAIEQCQVDIARIDATIEGLLNLRSEREKVVNAEIKRLDQRFADNARVDDEKEKALASAFAASEKAIEKAENAQLRVNTAQNEFRGALSDQAKISAESSKGFITRPELEGLDKRVQTVERDGVVRRELDTLISRVQAIEKGNSGGAGREGGIASARNSFRDNIAIVVSVLTLVTVLIFSLISALGSRQQQQPPAQVLVPVTAPVSAPPVVPKQ